MKLYHTSPEKITKINKGGTFGESLCFSNHIYYMTCATKSYVYSIDIETSQIIPASQFFYSDDCSKLSNIVSDIMRIAECDKEAAEELLSGAETHNDCEIDWTIQGIMGNAAQLLGYRAASIRDEQGQCYVVPFFGKEKELCLERED